MTTILSGEAAAQLEQKSAAVNAKAQGQPPQDAAAADGAGKLDLQTIHPDVPFPLAGRMVTMREYGHIEGLRVLVWAKPFVDGLYELVASGAGQQPRLSQIRYLMAEHADLVRDMVAQAVTAQAGDPAAGLNDRQELAQWIESLGDNDGQLLLAVWWRVNVNFFSAWCSSGRWKRSRAHPLGTHLPRPDRCGLRAHAGRHWPAHRAADRPVLRAGAGGNPARAARPDQ